MIAEVIAIGDELTSGQRIDTNSAYLSQRLAELGVRVMYHTTVGDDLDANVRVFQAAVERADVVVCTGGLGPTADDLTREAMADAAGAPLKLDEPSLKHIEKIFSRRGREMPERNRVQAMFPQGASVIFNPHGTAPGVDMDFHRRGGAGSSRVFALPGVPAEMKEMWDESVAPAIESMLPGERQVIRHRTLKCFGVGESDMEQMLPDLIRRGRSPSVGITVSKATITLRVTAKGRTSQECLDLMAPTIETIRDCLGKLVFGEGDDELEHAVARALTQRGETLATVEWDAGGLLSHWLSRVASPKIYLGGTVIRSATALNEFQQDASFAESANEKEEAAAMARICRERFGADYAIAVGRLSNASNQVDPQAPIAIAHQQGVTVKSASYAGHPDILQARLAKQALNAFRLYLVG